MKKIDKKNLLLIIIVIATIVLGAITIITALKLYQLGKRPVAPSVPESKPKATDSTCKLTLVIRVPSGSPTPSGATTPIPTATVTISPPTATPTSVGKNECFEECASDIDCQSNFRCLTYSGQKRCLNPTCPTEIDCACNPCWGKCTQDVECISGLKCLTVSGEKRCVNSNCSTKEDCTCITTPTSTPAPTTTSVPGGPTSTPRPTTVPTEIVEAPPQPVAGLKIPTVTGLGVGLFLISLGLALIF